LTKKIDLWLNHQLGLLLGKARREFPQGLFARAGIDFAANLIFKIQHSFSEKEELGRSQARALSTAAHLNRDSS